MVVGGYGDMGRSVLRFQKAYACQSGPMRKDFPSAGKEQGR